MSTARVGRIAGRPLLFALLISALTVAGCAKQQGQQEARAAPAQFAPAYCQPQPAPDCEFKGSTVKSVDPEEFNRLKLAYERRCVARAEKAERERLRELRAAGACEGRPTPSLAASR